MIRFRRSARRARIVLPLLLAVATLATPRLASAQFGSLLKKAAEKVGEKAIDKATGAEDKVSPRVNGAELSDDALGRLLRGLTVTADRLGQRDALQSRLELQEKAVSDLREPNQAAINAWESGHSTWSNCFSTQFSKLEKAHEGQTKVGAMKMMGDPKKAQAYAAMMQKYQTAQQEAMAAGDTLKLAEAQAKMMREMYGMMGIDLAADSAKARGACGAEPRKLPAMVKLEALEVQRDSLREQVRDIESTSQVAGAKAAAMDLAEFALQREKATVFLGSGNGGGMLTRDELNRLRAKRAELDKVKKAL